MKRLFNIVSLVLVGVSLCTCEQPEQEIPIPKITISDSVNADFESVSLTCTVTGNVTADRVIIDYSKDNSLAGSQTLSVQKQGDRFSVTILNLEIQTTYYYRYTIENSISKIVDKQIRQFKTLDYSAPSVKTVGAKEIQGKAAILEGEVLYTCGKSVLEKGFYIGPDKNSMTSYPVQQDGFIFKATELAYGTTYSFQAYAKTELGVGKGEILEFSTLSGKPELETTPATNITATSASFNGEIKSDGGSTITERGFCYSENETPTVNSTKVKIEGTIGQITTNITNLTPAKTYYARVYAVNEIGTHYGNEISFTTSSIPVESITLDRSEITMTEGESTSLTATVKPDNATDKTVTWSSSNTNVATVNNGVVKAISQGAATITARAGTLEAKCQVTISNSVPKGAVDLGLSVMWASCNLGASSPEEFGNYYAWGEIEPKQDYSVNTYKWYSGETILKYNYNSFYGVIDNKSLLDQTDDVAHCLLGGKWRMPTKNEIEELVATKDNSDYLWSWKTDGGCNGLEIMHLISRNRVFFPAAGYRRDSIVDTIDENHAGDYWSSSLGSPPSCPPSYAFSFSFYSKTDGRLGYYCRLGYYFRFYGLPIRPVISY